ncbi:hypothetical protein R69658_07839 [Paraburkholderia aspalathi]|uniref:Uncharacterized protein n=1 Tax=Paraburkholderia aspalathi TaxID=1324617 RepID=A0ABM8T7L3_9BURK|nr:hypothetical protein [Paraburkholderia aspalathi]MBK3824112.1 hypothetical protein [Paraburkholderia aspalathi]MBK3835954.1 hypothetical protein [Paraburkholderia aspalathi]MBK3865730.1 hypothetical protein [Paraburkholderia aspalathi]CAE6865524.1 hypothetical protein R69658_07839 [Paraburkholderia aspalathi]
MTELAAVTFDKPVNIDLTSERRNELANAADEAAQLFDLEVSKRPTRARLAHQARRIAAVLRMGGE